jgi:hypothetical protein
MALREYESSAEGLEGHPRWPDYKPCLLGKSRDSKGREAITKISLDSIKECYRLVMRNTFREMQKESTLHAAHDEQAEKYHRLMTRVFIFHTINFIFKRETLA